MTRKSIGPWTAREVAEAHLFERDLLGLPPRRRVRRSWKDSLGSRPPAESERDSESTPPPVEALELPPSLEIEPASAPELWEVTLPPAPAPAPAPAPPFPTNCTILSEFRHVPLEVETFRMVTAAGATTPPTPPVNVITTTAVPRIANFAARLRSQVQRAGPAALLVENTGRALIDTGHFRVDPADATRFEVRVKGQLCHPAGAVDRTKLPEGEHKFPVVVIIHGQHASIDFNLIDTGGPRRTVATSSGPVTLIPARATVAFEVPSFLGYTDLQEHLARHGIVSVSIDTNAANVIGSLMAFRGELGLAMLDHLRALDKDASSALHGRLDLTRVGVVGHSRGGDAVAILAARNARRKMKRRFGICSVVQIAPTDFTGMTRAPIAMNRTNTDSFLVVYGSHDGDVSGAFNATTERSQGWSFAGTGFRHYDRAATPRAMVFVHGATHNRFNSVWIAPARHRPGSDERALAEKQADNEVDARTVDPALPPATADPPGAGQRDRRVLSDSAHRTLMREYIGGWLFKHLQGNAAAVPLFNGVAANSLGTPVSLQWKHGPLLKTVDVFDDLNPRTSDIGGTSATPSFVKEQLIELSQLANIAHHDRVLRADAPAGPVLVYTTTIPAGKRDVSRFAHLTFRMSKVFPDVRTPAAIAGTAFPAAIQVALFDGTNRRSVNAAAIATLNPRVVRPYHRTRGSRNLTKVEMQTYAVPLDRYSIGSGAVTLSTVQAVEITFSATTGQEIHLDTLSFVRV